MFQAHSALESLHAFRLIPHWKSLSGDLGQQVEYDVERGDRVAASVRKMDAMNDFEAKNDDWLRLAHLDVTDRPSIHQGVTKPSPTSACMIDGWG